MPFLQAVDVSTVLDPSAFIDDIIHESHALMQKRVVESARTNMQRLLEQHSLSWEDIAPVNEQVWFRPRARVIWGDVVGPGARSDLARFPAW